MTTVIKKPTYQIKDNYLLIPIEQNIKGKQTFVIDMDEYEMDETGTKTKNGMLVTYIKFKLIK